MKALSIKQPWAWLIINAGKDIENRLWPTNFRGQFLIHAAKKMDRDFPAKLPPFSKIEIPIGAEIGYGGIVGIAEIIDCVRAHPSKWFQGPYGFVIANVRPLQFMPCRGQLGFFDIDYTPQNPPWPTSRPKWRSTHEHRR